MQRFIFIVILFGTVSANGYSAYSQNNQAPYSAAQANQLFKVGKDAYLRNDLKTAIGHFQASLKQWPVHQESWHWLAAAHQHRNQIDDYKHALFYRERTDWALGVDLRHAQRIFGDIAAGRTKTVKNNPRYIKTAKQLIIFYEYATCRAQAAREAELAKKLSFSQEYGLEAIMGLAPDPDRYPC